MIGQNLELVKLLVEHGASINAHASGDFLYSDIKLYFGGTILGFAACLDNKPIVVSYLRTTDAPPVTMTRP